MCGQEQMGRVGINDSSGGRAEVRFTEQGRVRWLLFEKTHAPCIVAGRHSLLIRCLLVIQIVSGGRAGSAREQQSVVG